jgi:pyruvate-formate lyase-activating enzyme
MHTALVVNVQRFSLNDGPGVRTTVFFKGCPLKCLWCHNPESQSFQPEIMFFPERCVNCGRCRAACPELDGNCAEGAEACAFDAKMLVGKPIRRRSFSASRCATRGFTTRRAAASRCRAARSWRRIRISSWSF